METTGTPVKKKPSLWLFVSIVLLIICAVLAWKMITYKSEITVLTVEKQGLTDEKAQMIANLEKLQKQYDQLSEENEGLTDMFEKEKEHVESLLTQIKSAQGSVAKYKGQVTALEGRLKEYEQQIEQLKSQNKELVAQNFDIKTSLDSTITENNSLNNENNNLTDKVNKGSVLSVYDMDASGIKISGKKEIPTVKSKRAEKIRVSFTIGENAIATAGQKDVFLRIADPSGNILSKTTGDEFSFDFQNNKLQYSIKETINYQNKPIDLCLYWDKTSDFVNGTYTVDIFADGNAIGTSTFIFEK
jgi:FtsZ-binding cell division protein ZapB